MNAPITTCPLIEQPCARGIDCSMCQVFLDRNLDVQWVCATCTVIVRDALDGTVPDEVVGGIYSSGKCARCEDESIVLIALRRRA